MSLVVVGKIIILLSALLAFIVWFCFCFDNAVLNRKGTVYRAAHQKKKIALTFDDGPCATWTPLILDQLKALGVKATFFVIGHHVQRYPDMARRIVKEGHLIANHGFAHSVILYYTLPEIEEEIKYTEQVVKDITGQTTIYYRPPKAWMLPRLKDKIKSLAYTIVLWSVNAKDWTPIFNPERWVNRLKKTITGGDIILLHDSGNVFRSEGGNRSRTVKVIPLLVKELRQEGFEFVTVHELLKA
jgi:peptidoglycan-N-acetylglucosamine deacetylase